MNTTNESSATTMRNEANAFAATLNVKQASEGRFGQPHPSEGITRYTTSKIVRRHFVSRNSKACDVESTWSSYLPPGNAVISRM